MSPLLEPGDRIHVRRARAGEIRRGDIILYTQRKITGHQLKVHRVLLLQQTPRGPVFWTKGDHEWKPDSPVPFFSVIGVVVGRERNGALKLLQTPWARAQAVALAAVGLGIFFFRRLAEVITHNAR